MKPGAFVAVDVETANPDLSSVCQIGLVVFEGGEKTLERGYLVNPGCDFEDFNISIHGITPADVEDAPTMAQLATELYPALDAQLVVSHTSFDRVAIQRALGRHGLRPPSSRWLDTLRVARTAWPDLNHHGLADVCAHLSYEFRHHDALDDARAAGYVLLRAMEMSGQGLSWWLDRISSDSRSSPKVTREGDPEGPYAGETLAFTGALTLPRANAADLAARAGFSVAAGVTKKTTMLVVGDQDVRILTGHDKSHKHRRAEALIAEGQRIRIVRETDFMALVSETVATK